MTNHTFAACGHHGDGTGQVRESHMRFWFQVQAECQRQRKQLTRLMIRYGLDIFHIYHQVSAIEVSIRHTSKRLRAPSSQTLTSAHLRRPNEA